MTLEHELIHDLISRDYLCTIPNFYIGAFECDVFTLNRRLYTTEYEIKISKSDFNRDFEKTSTKWRNRGKGYHGKHDQVLNGKRTNRFYFVLPKDMKVEIPKYAGVIRFSMCGDEMIFNREKMAPLLHKKHVDNKMIKHCLSKTNWKYYSCFFNNDRKENE